jgi:hypothetical protein
LIQRKEKQVGDGLWTLRSVPLARPHFDKVLNAIDY